MAGAVEDRTKAKFGALPRWWEKRPDQLRALEELSLPQDRTIRRLDADEIERNRDLRTFVEAIGIHAEDDLAYLAFAEGPLIESRDVVEKCAPSSGMVSYGLRWFCSLLSLEGREKLVHRAGAEGAAGHQPLLMDLLQHGSHKA